MAHVLFLADLARPDCAGGAQTVAWELAMRLHKLGYRSTFLVTAAKLGLPSSEVIDGTSIRRLAHGLSPWEQIKARRTILAGLKSAEKIGLIHSHFAYSELGVRHVLPSVPFVRSFYGPWDEEGWVEDRGSRSGLLLKARLKRRLRGRIERASLRRADRVVYLSRFSRSQLDPLRVDPAKLKEIPGGTDIARFFPNGARDEARSKLGIKLQGEGPLLFCLRRLALRMGIDALIESMSSVVTAFPHARLIIGGRGPEYTRLQALILKMGLQESVTLAGFIPDEQLADYHRAADLFVLPTTALEGFGLVTVDALACGTPVVGTPIGATPEILAALDKRLVTRGTSATELAEGILEFLRGTWRHELTQERLHAYVKERYTWEKHVEGVLRVYEELLSEARPRG